ncbi:MAG: dihydrofolate reductase [Acidimicrobiales bacterium]|nr:dihydrofolate reductase [Acidimicrobiales bacterium]
MNRVFIATSLDGYIATEDHGLDWLDQLPNPDDDDYGFDAFMDATDALLMGRRTFEVIKGFRPWPYNRPVFVASASLTLADLPDDLAGSVHVVTGSPAELVAELHRMGHETLYVDGGSLITSFLEAGLIDEMTISRLPVVLGSGIPLFGPVRASTWWDHIETTAFANGIVASTYRRQPLS